MIILACGQGSETGLDILDGREKKSSKQFRHNSIVLAVSRREKWIDMINYNSSCTGDSLRSVTRSDRGG